MKVNLKAIIMLVLVVVAVILLVSLVSGGTKKDEALVYSDVVDLFEADRVKTFKVDGDLKLTMELYLTSDHSENAATEFRTYVLSYGIQLEKIVELAEFNAAYGSLVSYDLEPAAETPWYVAYLPYIIFAVLLGILWFFLMRQTSGTIGKMNSFSKSKAHVSMNDKNAVKFADVAGADEEKAELEEVVDFLKDPTKYVKLGARIPRGVLLVGPPGTGKTLLAKAVAGEAGVPFFSISGSDFVEMYVGVGASRVRDLFDSARRVPASIIFIDEIDAVGRHRGAGLGGGHDEREQTLNQLLVEMDGFGTNSGVIVMAATNRPDILDPALLRPGRFDRRITVNYPDIKGREAILKVHSRNKPLEETVDLQKIAQTTIGFTGAELANLMNEAALHAAKKHKSLIGMEDIEASYMKMLLGPQKKSKLRREADNKLCAYHEAGHAVASYYCKHTDPVKHITIIPAGGAGGVTISVPTEDRMVATKGEMIDQIVLALGGRVAEELILEDISTGASNDIGQATNIARNMVTRYGMSDLGTVLYGSEHSEDEVFLGRDFSAGKNYSEKTAAEIDEVIRKIISDAQDTCRSILTEHIDKLKFVAEFLLKYESMDEDQFTLAMETDSPDLETIAKVAEDRREKSKEENKVAEENAKRAEEEENRRKEEGKSSSHGSAAGDDFLDNFFRDMDGEPRKTSEPKEEPDVPAEPEVHTETSGEMKKTSESPEGDDGKSSDESAGEAPASDGNEENPNA